MEINVIRNVNNKAVDHSVNVDKKSSEIVSDKKEKICSGVDAIEISHQSDETEKMIQLYGKGDRFTGYADYIGRYKVEKSIQKLYDGYYAGNISVEDITKEFETLVSKIQEFDRKLGIYVEGDAEHYGEIVSDVRRKFHQIAVQSAHSANWREGKELSGQYGDSGSRSFLYYNADYYYMSKDITDQLLECATEMTSEAGTVLRTDYSQNVLFDRYENFNTFWKADVRGKAMVGDMIDTDLEPPKDFKFFYKEDRYTEEDVKSLPQEMVFDGILKVSYGDWGIESNVNLKYGAGEENGHTSYELLSRFSGDIDEKLVKFLNNINIHYAFYHSHYLYDRGYYGKQIEGSILNHKG